MNVGDCASAAAGRLSSSQLPGTTVGRDAAGPTRCAWAKGNPPSPGHRARNTRTRVMDGWRWGIVGTS